MDSFDYSDDAAQTGRARVGIVWNVLTVLVILMAVMVCLVVAVVYINPNLSINPFPPPTYPSVATFPTATPTPRVILPPTWTPTLVPTSTATLTPTIVVPTETSVIGTPSGEDETTEVPSGSFTFVLHEGDPLAIPNIGHQDLGCSWMGVGGQAFDLSGAPIQGLIVQLGGSLDGETKNVLGLTGMVTNYGAGSYEFELADSPVESRQTLWVQLLDQASLPLSDKLYFDTFDDCDRNLILINFNQVR